MQSEKSKIRVRKLVMTAMLAAVATVLMFLSFGIPLVPSYLKLDFSELPALIASFSMGPLSGVVVCLVKNLINLMNTTTAGVGELSNFILGCLFVVPAGLIYNKWKTRKGALAASLIGAVAMAVGSIATNYFLVYPAYSLLMPMDVIMGMYQALLPWVNDLLQALVVFNMPFTLFKGLCDVLLTFLLYKHISPLIKGTRREIGKK